jgi:hypothetical protein
MRVIFARSRVGIAVAGLIALTATRADAQSAAAARLAPPDSIVTRMVFTSILFELSHYLGAGVVDTTLRAWTIELPSSVSPVHWPRVDAELRRLLRAREPIATDRQLLSLSIDELRVTSDSLVLRFTIAGRSRCPTGDEWAGGSTGYELQLAWAYRTSGERPRPYEFTDGMCIASRLQPPNRDP